MRSVALAALAGVLWSAPAFAGVVVLNADQSQYTFGETRALVRYRTSQTNWDQIVATSSSISTSTIVQQANLGTLPALNGVAWDFVLNFRQGIGYEWTLSRVGGSQVSTVRWEADFNGVSPLRQVNAIRFYAEAGATMPGGIATAQMSVTNLAFSASGFTNTGTLVDLVDDWDDVGPNDGNDPDLPSQAIIADADLTTTDWTFSGRVRASWTFLPGFTAPAGNLDERLKLDVKMGSAIPSAGSLAILGVAAAVVSRRRRA